MKSFLILIAITLTVAPLANKEFKQQLRKSTIQWDNKTQNHSANYDTDQTWLDVGVRFKYAAMKSLLSIQTLETLSGHKVFIGDSPHGEHPNFKSQDKFGHYNPKFISELNKSLTQMLKNESFKPMAQTLYDNNLKNLARTYYLSYAQLDDDRTWKGKTWTKENIQETYQDIINGNNTSNGNGANFLNEVYRSYADQLETDGYDWYEADVAPGFWIRRTIDGTDDDFAKLLILVLDHLDPEFDK